MNKGLNLGIAKAIVSNKITNEFLNESEIKSKGLVNKLVETIKKSPILMKEYSVYDNIEHKYTDNDIIASKFIDNNMARFSDYSVEEINEAHKLLEDVVDMEDVSIISESKLNLYNSIGTLIQESNNPDGDVNKLHQAYESVLTHIKENVKEAEKEESTLDLNENINIDDVIALATEKYNETFSSLNESDVELVKTLVFGSEPDKKELFEGLKSENIKSLQSIESNGVADKISEAIDKLNKMVYSEETLAKNIVELKSLKESLN
jgi:hypothetical protein